MSISLLVSVRAMMGVQVQAVHVGQVHVVQNQSGGCGCGSRESVRTGVCGSDEVTGGFEMQGQQIQQGLFAANTEYQRFLHGKRLLWSILAIGIS